MTEPTPQGLTRPTVLTTTLSRKPVLLVCLLVAIIIGLLVFSIFDEGNQNATKEDESALIKPSGQATTTTDEEGLNLPEVPEQRGVTLAPSAQANDKLQEPIMVLPSPEVEPLDEIRKKEELKIRQYKFEQRLAALESKPIAYRKSTAAVEENEQVATNSSHRLAQLQNELAIAQASVLGGNQQPTQTSEVVTNSNDDWSNGYDLQKSKPYSVLTGSIIPVVLLTGIKSTLPGEIIGQVSLPVYDTATGKDLLIPGGTKVFGEYQNEVAMGQDRLFVVWKRLIFPDGRTMTLSNMPGADLLGYSGLKDEVDNHYLSIYGHAILMSLVTGGTSYAIDTLNTNKNDDSTTIAEAMGSALATQMGQTTMSLLERYMSISPTLTIRSGKRLNVIVVKDLEFEQPYQMFRR